MLKIGRVTHYYDKIGVAVVELASSLFVGDVVKFVHGGNDMFEQTVESIQVEHNKLDYADRGDVIGLKTNEKVVAGTEVFKKS